MSENAATPVGQWFDCGEAEELKKKSVRQVSTKAGEIALIYKDDRFSAISGICPHAAGPLGYGGLSGDYVVCPLHRWKYHCRTGAGESSYEGEIPIYDTKVEGGHVFVDVKSERVIKVRRINEELIAAIKKGDFAETEKLVGEGANVNHVDTRFLTPLLHALFKKHMDLAKYLIEKGANINYDRFSEGTALSLAAFSGDEAFVALLLKSGAHVNHQLPHSGETALHNACVAGHAAVVKTLIAAGADVNLETKADVTTDMFSGGVRLWGETALHFAAAYGDKEMIEALTGAGADKYKSNTHGESATNYAGRHKRPREILQLLW